MTNLFYKFCISVLFRKKNGKLLFCRTGCLLGLSQAIVSMCKDGKPESRAHVSSVLTKLTDCLVNTEASHPDYQVSHWCGACKIKI